MVIFNCMVFRIFQEGVFFQFGQLLAMALLQRGGALNLGPSTYNFMCEMKPTDIIVSAEEITDCDVKLILEKVLISYSDTNNDCVGLCIMLSIMCVWVHVCLCVACMCVCM